jgi:hypothetical protein
MSIPRVPQWLIDAGAGGIVDETRVTLALYGEALDPAEITRTLGCSPTHSFTKGFIRSERSTPMPHGAWFLTLEGKTPLGPDQLIASLLRKFSLAREAWLDLAQHYDLQLRVAVHLDNWNRAFSLSRETLAEVELIGARLEFDIYADGEDMMSNNRSRGP